MSSEGHITSRADPGAREPRGPATTDRRALGPAFKLLEEAQLFCQRHFPLPAKVVPEQLRRVETPLIPPDAMREILVNALIHRDYSIAGGAISLAIFDDRVEVWSAGKYPNGITPLRAICRSTD